MENKMETTKIDVAKKLLELRIKVQMGIEVDILTELDKLIIEVLNIETRGYIPYGYPVYIFDNPLMPKDPYKPTVTNGGIWTVSSNNTVSWSM